VRTSLANVLRRRRSKVVALGAVAALLLTGCGLRPGQAARVGDTTIRVEQVDDFARALCTVNKGQGASGQPTSGLRETSASVLIQNVLFQGVAKQEGLTVDRPKLGTDLEQAVKTLPPMPASEKKTFTDTLRDYLTGQQYVDQLGRTQLALTDQKASSQAIAQAGAQQVSDYAKTVDVEVDPRFGTWSDGRLERGDGSLSVPVSSNATAAAASQPAQSFVDSLPASQKCG
jgi:hypothetical protein